MKKLFVTSLALVLLGTGCLGGQGSQTAEGDWTLAFDLPEGWVMVAPYQAADSPINVDAEITADDTEVYLQSTTDHILTGGIGIDEDRLREFGTIRTEDFTQISVLKLDPRRVIPSEAEDLGNGFFKETVCEEGEDCTIYNQSRFRYYLKSEGVNYRFSVTHESQDLAVAEEVILSAQAVTTTLE